jgi:hypothetical protein
MFSTIGFEIASNRTAILIIKTGIPTIRAQIIKNLNSKSTSMTISFRESPRFEIARTVLFFIASKTAPHSVAIMILA